jgi:hypothetical protein
MGLTFYSFGGTDGTQWFNDVWTYDARTNQWSELDCIGYIPAPREGHAAALVNDTMYIFGGRLQDGTDLGDLAAFRISSRRWYMFQNMGSSPSARSGHSMTAVGKHIVVLAGEPSSAPRDATELSFAYVLDTTKIRYPQSESGPIQGPGQAQPIAQSGPGGQLPLRKFSNDQSRIPQKSSIPITAGQSFSRPTERPQQPQPQSQPEVNGASGPPSQSRLPRNASSGPPPPQAAPQPRGTAGTLPGPPGSRSRTPTRNAPTDTKAQMYDRENMVSPGSREPVADTVSPSSMERGMMGGAVGGAVVMNAAGGTQSRQGPPSRSASRTQRQQASLDSTGRSTPRQSEELTRTSTRDTVGQVDSGLGSSPSLSQHNNELSKELEAAKSRNAWLASELALARKSGYNTSSSGGNSLLDQQAANLFDDDDRPLIEALLEMKAELARVQGAIETQADSTAARIAEMEKQRDAAISEAVYAKAKLAAHGGSQAGTPQPDANGTSTPDIERNNDMGKRLASMLTAHNELNTKLENLTAELESEKRARRVMEESAEASQKRASELDLYKQRAASELESLRAELHEARRVARDESTKCAEALASLRMHELDKNDIANKHAKAVSETKSHAVILQTLREAVTASTEKADLLERRIAEERELREIAEQKHAQLRTQHDDRLNELASTSRKLKETEELAQKHAEEARTHKAAVLSGLDRVSARGLDDDDINDERVTVLRQQLDVSNDMARQHKSAADAAADRLRRAEERIAGLEAYQEQTTRESLSLRKQLQNAVKEVQAAQSERTAMQQKVERNQLEGNALEVQLRTLKNLLEERGISTADVRRSRALDSPSSRYGTPEMNRVRELERQLDQSIKAHDEVRSSFEQREQDLNREWEEKIVGLENDREGAMKYVRGLEKMLAKMKQELQKAKAANVELERGMIERANAANSGSNGASQEWEAERNALRNEIAEQQKSVKTTMSALEAQITTLKTTLSQAEKDRDVVRRQATESQAQHEARMNSLAERANAELEALRHENLALEDRAADAEQKVQLFLDQFETSVDNYRRQSRLENGNPNHSGPNGISRHGHGHTNSVSGESMYSNMTDTTEDDATDNSGELTPSAHSFPTAGFAGGIPSAHSPDKASSSGGGHGRDRSSTALDSLATELDALRSHWEESSKKNYRLSDKFDFEKPSPAGLGLSGEASSSTTTPELGSAGLGDWRKKMDLSLRSNASDVDEKGKESLSPKIGAGAVGSRKGSPVVGTGTS